MVDKHKGFCFREGSLWHKKIQGKKKRVNILDSCRNIFWFIYFQKKPQFVALRCVIFTYLFYRSLKMQKMYDSLIVENFQFSDSVKLVLCGWDIFYSFQLSGIFFVPLILFLLYFDVGICTFTHNAQLFKSEDELVKCKKCFLTSKDGLLKSMVETCMQLQIPTYKNTK